MLCVLSLVPAVLMAGDGDIALLSRTLDLPVVDAWSRRYDIDVSDIFY